MQNESLYSNLIYEYFLLRFQFQYYRFGDTLPPIDILYKEFNVSPQTVRAALQRLRAEGYLSMGNGQCTRVLFQQTKQELADHVSRFYSRRRDAFSDLYASGEIMFVPMLVEGLRRMDEDDIASISVLAERAGADDLFHFYCFTLQKTENPLALNLFWEVCIFQGFPFAKNGPGLRQFTTNVIRKRLKTLVSYIKARDWDSAHAAFLEYQRSDIKTATAFLAPHFKRSVMQDQIPFTWRIYRERPQLCYNLASHILHEIYLGEYRDVSYLPSYAKMAEKYGVSFSTIRRTVDMLCQIGAARSIKGKGTRIFGIGVPCDRPDFENPAIRRNLSFFVQSYELLLYSCQGVTLSLMEGLTAEARGNLISQYETCLNTGRSELAFWYYLNSVIEYSKLAAIREIYKKIYALFLWGYPLKAFSGGSPQLDLTTLQFTQDMIRYLKADDAHGCAGAVRALIAKLLPAAERFLAGHGIRPEKLRTHPSIRLLITTGQEGLPPDGSGTGESFS